MAKTPCFYCGGETKLVYNSYELFCGNCKDNDFCKKNFRQERNGDLRWKDRKWLMWEFPSLYYSDWKIRYSDKKVLNISEIPEKKEYNHAIGIVSKVFVKNSTKFMIIKDLKTEDTKPVVLKNEYADFITINDVFSK